MNVVYTIRVDRASAGHCEPSPPPRDQHVGDCAARVPVGWIDLLDVPDVRLAVVLESRAAMPDWAHA